MEAGPRFNKISPESETYSGEREHQKDNWTHWDVFGRGTLHSVRSYRDGAVRRPELVPELIRRSKEDFIARLENKDIRSYALRFVSEGIRAQGVTEETFPLALS